MTTSPTATTSSYRRLGRLLAGGLLALGLAACGAENATHEADAPASPESAPAALAQDAPASPEAARGGKGRGEHGRHGPKDAARFLERFDANGDGKLAVAELPERAQKRASGADVDKDGFVTADELRTQMQARGKERFAKHDKNGDGFLTKDEAGEKRWDRMKVADANGDDKLTFEELKEARQSGKLAARQHKKGKGGRRGAAEEPQR